MRVWAKFMMSSSPAKAGLIPPGSQTRPGHPYLRGSCKATAKGGLQGRKLSGTGRQGCAWTSPPAKVQPTPIYPSRGKPGLQFVPVFTKQLKVFR